ncbi:MAG: Coenzyme F420 hydrogenase/dehydrogenase, beta subunit C-terminal domain [Pseudomonadota bacterium]
MTMSPTLQEVDRGDLCAGCGACASIAPGKIRMTNSPDGFLRPQQTSALDREQEDALSKVCPGIRVIQDPAGRKDHVLWGPYISIKTGYATDPRTRKNGSSGGVVTAVAQFLQDSGKVDRVLQVAASTPAPALNESRFSSSSEEILNSAGSRYAPSAPLEEIHAALELSGKTAVIGKPCDIAGLRAMAKLDPRIDEKIPFMLSFFCAGVPSAHGVRALIEKMGVDPKDLVQFRYRGDGWPGVAKAVTSDGKVSTLSYAESWGDVLSKHVQFRCKVCPDGTGGHADLVCADAWECDEKGYPVFEEQDGISLIVTRTEKGSKLFEAASEAGVIESFDQDVAEIAAMQPGQYNRRRLLGSRMLALKVARRPFPRFENMNIRKASQFASFPEKARSFGGTLRRLRRLKGARRSRA